MKRLIVLLALVGSLTFASTAQAGTYNTGWPCSTPGQFVQAGGGSLYLCAVQTHTWWILY